MISRFMTCYSMYLLCSCVGISLPHCSFSKDTMPLFFPPRHPQQRHTTLSPTPPPASSSQKLSLKKSLHFLPANLRTSHFSRPVHGCSAVLLVVFAYRFVSFPPPRSRGYLKVGGSHHHAILTVYFPDDWRRVLLSVLGFRHRLIFTVVNPGGRPEDCGG